MCGLVGVLTTSKRSLNNNELKMFKMMLRFDVIRGDHSTGMIGIDREKGGATIYKHMGGPITEKTFTSNGGKNPLFKDDGDLKTPLRALFGHNRFATMGKLDVDNAHPFIAGKLVGMHNGTVKPYILERIEKENPYGTDSEFIYNKIHENGLAPTIKELDGGAWCLTYYDFHKKTYNFLRNDERPLYIAWDKLGTMAWASEEWMIKIAANKCWWKYDEISMLKPNTHLEIDEEGNVEKTEVKAEKRGFFHNRSQTYTQVYSRTNTTGFNVEEKNAENIRKMKDKVVELSPVRILSEHGQEYIECHLEGWSDPDDKAVVPWASVRIYLQKKDKDLRDWVNEPYMPTGDFLYCSVKVKDIKCTPAGKLYAVGDRRTIEGPYHYETITGHSSTVKGYGGTVLYREEFEKKVKEGCSHCLQVPQFEDGDNVLWVDPTTFLCDECVSNKVPDQYGIDSSNIIYM